jgi:hypothetical protein
MIFDANLWHKYEAQYATAPLRIRINALGESNSGYPRFGVGLTILHAKN